MNKCVSLHQERKIGVMVWMPKEIVEKFKIKAQERGLSLSSYVRSLIFEHIKENEEKNVM
jgi:predicted DNA binding CopG/RHH family protein